MALKSAQANKSTGSARTPAQGIVFKVETYEGDGTKGSPLTMKGTAALANDFVKEGEEITVIMSERFNNDRVKPLLRYNGKNAGSIFMLDSCYRHADGHIVAGWANTLVSEKERSDPSSGHNNRAVLTVVSEVPTLRLINPKVEDGEPEVIYWSLNQDVRKFSAQGDSFDRAWLAAKVAAADWKKVRVHFDVYDPSTSVLVSNQEELSETLSALISDGHSALIRAFDTTVAEDGERTVETRKAMGNQDNDAQSTLDYLAENGVINGYENDVLFSEVASGNVALEVIKMDRKYYVSDSKESIVSGFTGGKAKQMVGAFGMADRTARLAEVFLPVQIQNAGQDDEWSMPVGPMTRAGAFSGSFDAMPSPNFSDAPVVAAPAAPASTDSNLEDDLDADLGDDAEFETPGLG